MKAGALVGGAVAVGVLVALASSASAAPRSVQIVGGVRYRFRAHVAPPLSAASLEQFKQGLRMTPANVIENFTATQSAGKTVLVWDMTAGVTKQLELGRPAVTINGQTMQFDEVTELRA